MRFSSSTALRIAEMFSFLIYLNQLYPSQGPLSVDRFPEGDDDVDVDVEQCSDSEAQSRSRTPRTTSNNSRATPPSPSDEERLTPEPVKIVLKRIIEV